MEHIGKVLGSLNRGKATQNQKTKATHLYDEAEPTLEEKKEQLRRSMGISSFDNTFKSFKVLSGTEQAYKAFKELAGDAGWRMLLCYGGVGNGKTHLCEALVIELYKQGVHACVFTMAKMMRALKHGINPEVPRAYDDILEDFCTRSHLIVDDVGMGGSGSEWEFGQLEEIVVIRYRERLFTVLTSNRDLTDLPERIISRFRDPDVGRLILNSGKDYRRRKGGK